MIEQIPSFYLFIIRKISLNIFNFQTLNPIFKLVLSNYNTNLDLLFNNLISSIIYNHYMFSAVSANFSLIPSINIAIAPSPVTLQAVPKLS